MNRQLTAKAEVLIIVLLACVPLFIHFPYRVNIFLSWEGAYRISQGQVPFRDFGLPLGGMYWLVPAFFFKLFGAKLITLVKAQVFINIVAGVSFRSILRSLSVNKGIRLSSVLLFCLSYSFFNFWPWYNHSVIVYELVALAFLLRYVRAEKGDGVMPENGEGVAAEVTGSDVRRGAAKGGRYRLAWLAGAAFFTVCSLLTKQDGGGLAFLVAGVVLAAHGWVSGKWKPLLLFVGSYVVLLFLMVLPFLSNGFGYWFNHGQAPHSSRVSPFDIAAEFFGSSQWIKFYFFLTVLLAVVRYRRWAVLKADRQGVLLLVLTWGMLVEAAVLQVTSYTPPDNNIFFHSFAFAGILSLLAPLLPAGLEKSRRMTVVLVAGVLLWWSGVWWKYTERLTGPLLARQPAGAVSPTGENVVNKDSYMINRDTATDIPTEQWIECGLPAFSKITLPAPTVAGIRRLMEMDLVRRAREGGQPGGPAGGGPGTGRPGGEGRGPGSPAGEGLRVLNMSELTPLAAEIPFALEKNGRLPLWYHLGVGMFNRQADTFETRIRQHYYDLVLFEYIPTLNNFYPFRVRDSLHLHYNQVDSFMAPRRGVETQGVVEVYVRPVQ